MKRILLQLDTDERPSVFDRVVAVDSGVDELFSYGGVTPENVEALVHGAMFTRGGDDLRHTAIFIGGSDVAASERLAEKVSQTFFGPVRVSVMIDPNGSNTTAAAAVLAAGRHVAAESCEALILGGTGPVGQRAAQLLASQGAVVRVGSRSINRAQSTCESIARAVPGSRLTAVSIGSEEELQAACDDVDLLLAAGAAGVQFLTEEQWSNLEKLRVAIDVNAVPPLGLEGVDVMDKARERHGKTCYGAIGVGGTKMKIHKATLGRLFDANDQVFDTEAIFQVGQEIE